jgi:uncharacterized protein (DUF488 family)
VTVLYTVGHGNRSTEELVAVLRAAGVRRLVDVRRYPASRRNPHLSEEALRRSLPELGIAYEWWGEALGGRRRARGAGRHVAWREAAFAGYADHTDTPVFREAVVRLAASAAEVPTAVMCAEVAWWRCHRRLIADTLALRGLTVVHLVDPFRRLPHRLHPGARLGDDGWPVWDLAADRPLL